MLNNVFKSWTLIFLIVMHYKPFSHLTLFRQRVFLWTNHKLQRPLFRKRWYSSHRCRNGSNFTRMNISKVQKPKSLYNCQGHRAGSACHSSPSPPPSLLHATQVAGGLGLSLTAANYRLTRPRCALHDCLAPRSGYPEWGRNRQRWRERWLGRTEKDRGAEGGGGKKERKKEEIESGRNDRGDRERGREKRRSRTVEGMNGGKRKGERSGNGREVYSGGTGTVD